MILKTYSKEERDDLTLLFGLWFDWYLEKHGLGYDDTLTGYQGKTYKIRDVFLCIASSLGLMNSIKPILDALETNQIEPKEYLSELVPFLVDYNLL